MERAAGTASGPGKTDCRVKAGKGEGGTGAGCGRNAGSADCRREPERPGDVKGAGAAGGGYPENSDRSPYGRSKPGTEGGICQGKYCACGRGTAKIRFAGNGACRGSKGGEGRRRTKKRRNRRDPKEAVCL